MIELDWEITDALPDEDHLPPPEPPPSRPPEVEDPGWRLPRRWWLLPLVLLALAGLGFAATTWIGWRRVRAQISDQVAYEDERSLARDVEVVESMQAPVRSTWASQWVRQRAREAVLGLPASLPAGNLVPVPGSLEVLDVTVPEPGMMEATILRTFADSAGERYQFEYVQRYRNLAPGQWERLPPDETRFENTATWIGRRLTATYPLLDELWALDALPRIDSYLVAACDDWGCPDDVRLSLKLSGTLYGLPVPPGVLRDPTVPPYPITFDLVPPAVDPPPISAPRRVVLPSPHLAGYPHDEAASEALIRATTVKLLVYLASELAGSSSDRNNYFLHALIARAEIRLGLSPAPAVPEVTPSTFVHPTDLWASPRIGSASGGDLLTATRLHLQTLGFLNFALASHPPSADGRLLHNLGRQADLTIRWTDGGGGDGGTWQGMRRQSGLATWLETSLDLEAEPLFEEWVAAITASFEASEPVPWGRLNGLAYACEDGLWLVQEGAPRRLPVGAEMPWLLPEGLSADGARLAVLDSDRRGEFGLQIIDLASFAVQTVNLDDRVYPLGWTAAGQFAYLDTDQDDGFDSFPHRLTLYDLAARAHQRVALLPVGFFWGSQSVWSPDHTALGLTLVEDRAMQQTRPAIVSLDPDVPVQFLASLGHSPVFSPDGARIAYVANDDLLPDPSSDAAIELLDVQSGTTTQIITAGTPGLDQPVTSFALSGWSPDGRILAFAAMNFGSGQSNLFTVTPGEGDLRQLDIPAGGFISPLNFSADSRYLSIVNYASGLNELIILDLETEKEEVYVARFAAWSPQGHLIAILSPGGVYVTDPATGDLYWLASAECNALAWYRLP